MCERNGKVTEKGRFYAKNPEKKSVGIYSLGAKAGSFQDRARYKAKGRGKEMANVDFYSKLRIPYTFSGKGEKLLIIKILSKLSSFTRLDFFAAWRLIGFHMEFREYLCN